MLISQINVLSVQNVPLCSQLPSVKTCSPPNWNFKNCPIFLEYVGSFWKLNEAKWNRSAPPCESWCEQSNPSTPPCSSQAGIHHTRTPGEKTLPILDHPSQHVPSPSQHPASPRSWGRGRVTGAGGNNLALMLCAPGMDSCALLGPEGLQLRA